MSSTGPTPSSPNPTAATTAAGHPGSRGTNRHAGGNDLFAQLMLLLGSAQDAPGNALAGPSADSDLPRGTGNAAPMADTGSETPADNPLAALMAWPSAAHALATGDLSRAAEGTDSADPARIGRRLAMEAGRDGQSAAMADGVDARTRNGDLSLPSGLQRLEHPEQLDPDTLLAMGRPATGGGAESEASITAPRATGARGAAGHPLVVGGAGGAGHRVQVLRSSDASQNPAMAARSTVLLDERFARLQRQATAAEPGTDAPTDTPAAAAGGWTGIAADRAVSPAVGEVATRPEAGAVGEASGADSGDHAGHSHRDSGADAHETPPGQATDDATPGTWGAQQLRHANLRVGEAGEQAIDIQLNMSGQALQVDFRTDDAQTRAQLAQEAGSLGDLLQRSGIELGGVSVGAQGHPSGHAGQTPDNPPRPPAGRAPAQQAGAQDPAPAAVPPPRPRTDGTRPLDLFI